MNIYAKRLSLLFAIFWFLSSIHIPGLLIGCHKQDDYPPTELVSNCFNWPSQEFSPTNKAGLSVAFAPGDTAVDFTLQDTDGQTYSLSSLLETKPVLIVFGAFT